MAEKTNNQRCNSSPLQFKTHFSRDLLQRFTGSKNPTGSDREEEDEPELNLGLSLNGRFGIDKSKLIRSSSIASILPVTKDDDVLRNNNKLNSGLTRTASLPVETEGEWRKRKELQSLRRLAAKRRRCEKQKNLTKVEGEEENVAAMGRVGLPIGSSLGSGNWDFGVAATSDGDVETPVPAPVPGSVESQASTLSEFESRHVQGSSTEGEVSPASVQSSQEPSNQNSSSSSKPKPETRDPSNNKGKEIRSNTVDMPCVFTQGDGPRGRRIEGILYKYGKGEEVKIMCVCHGSFLSPAEFVKHAGGTNVGHPLKHIVVNPSSSYL